MYLSTETPETYSERLADWRDGGRDHILKELGQ